jgi:hypothetical protein
MHNAFAKNVTSRGKHPRHQYNSNLGRLYLKYLMAFIAGLLLFGGLLSADTMCATASGQAYSGSGSCIENGYSVQYSMKSFGGGMNLNNLLVTPLVSGGVRGFDITGTGPLRGDYMFSFSLTPLAPNEKITSFTESVGGSGAGIVDTGFACDKHNSCNYFNLHSTGNNTVTYNYSPGSVKFLSHEDVNIIKGGTYGFVDKRVSVTPEPSSLLLIGTGLLSLSFYLRRRRRAQANQALNPLPPQTSLGRA